MYTIEVQQIGEERIKGLTFKNKLDISLSTRSGISYTKINMAKITINGKSTKYY